MDKEKFLNFVKTHREIFALAGLLVLCYFLYFFSMGHYSLIDVDETRYVTMSRNMFYTKDYLTLFLNGDFFFEKPPLYFWLETLSFMIFKHVSEVTARIPVALTATYGVFLTYFLGKRICSKKYGIVCAVILATCFEYVVLARVAILDMLLSVCIASSAFAGIYTLFCRDNYKKYFWWLAYIMAGFGVLAKGIPGVAVPALTIFFSYLVARKWKELFKPLYIIPGLLFFFIVSLPWHVVMLNLHGQAFFHEYIFKHHIERFVNSHELGRKQPFYYFIPVFFLGFMPWIFSFISQLVVCFKKHFKKTEEYTARFNDLQRLEQFVVLNVIFFLVVFIFFSAASTKLPTYILPAMFPAALILGKFWFDYIWKDENERAVNISTLVLNFAFIATAIGLFVAPSFVREADRAGLLAMQIPGVIVILASVLLNSFAVFKDKKLLHFLGIAGFMAVLSMFSTKYIFPYVLSFQQNQLIEYSKMAKVEGKRLASWGFGKKYSLLYYGAGEVDFLGKADPASLELNPKTYLIIENKKGEEFSKYFDYEVLKKGTKYSLITDIIKK
ncbi:MAG: glycosyltransferase family 39 protein [Clostridium sp.]|nr:glycosyltransferase family 39 protein [Clostridium sp.]